MSKKRKLKIAAEPIDLVPMIDVIFLILLFFMLVGRLSMDQRHTQITVPPTRTAQALVDPTGWKRVIINVFGSTQGTTPGRVPANSIAVDQNPPWVTAGVDDYSGYQRLRQMLNAIYDKVEKYDDPKGTGMKLPRVLIEIRADAETEYRVVQEVQQILSDTIDPFDNMLPRNVRPTELKSFVNIDFTTRRPDDRS